MRLQAFIALLVLGAAGHALGAEREPLPELPRCADDPETAPLAVKLAYSDLMTIHRARVPGPSGQRVIDSKVDQLLARTIDLERFAATALSPMWVELGPDHQRLWGDDLRVGLRGHYLKRLTGEGSPLGRQLDITTSEVSCDRATIRATLASRREPRDRTELVLQLRWTGLGWRAFDVSVDGVSLLETWKTRFRRIYRDGGVMAIDEHLRELAERHRQ